jgi:hydrogenase maturation protease
LVLRSIAEHGIPTGVALHFAATPLDLLDCLVEDAHVLVVDAARSGLPAGTVCLHADAIDCPLEHPVVSSHGLDLGGTLELARTLGRLPKRLDVLTIEIVDAEPETPLSPYVIRAIPRAVERVREWLDRRTTRDEAPRINEFAARGGTAR